VRMQRKVRRLRALEDASGVDRRHLRGGPHQIPHLPR
jgi:hypothetical protein